MNVMASPITGIYNDVIMSTIASQITSLTIVYATVYSGADQRKHQSSASLAFVQGPVNSPHKGPVTRKMFPFDDVTMGYSTVCITKHMWLSRLASSDWGKISHILDFRHNPFDRIETSNTFSWNHTYIKAIKWLLCKPCVFINSWS